MRKQIVDIRAIFAVVWLSVVCAVRTECGKTSHWGVSINQSLFASVSVHRIYFIYDKIMRIKPTTQSLLDDGKAYGWERRFEKWRICVDCIAATVRSSHPHPHRFRLLRSALVPETPQSTRSTYATHSAHAHTKKHSLFYPHHNFPPRYSWYSIGSIVRIIISVQHEVKSFVINKNKGNINTHKVR